MMTAQAFLLLGILMAVLLLLCFCGVFLTVKEELLDKNRLSCFMPGSAALAAAD